MVAMPCPKKHPKTGIYQFRRAVPKDLREKLGWEIKCSLGTSVPAEAKLLYAAELEKSDTLFEQTRSGFTLSDKNAQALAGKWLTEALEADLQVRESGEPDDEQVAYDEDYGPYEHHMDAMESAHRIGILDPVVGKEVDSLIRQEGIPVLKGNDEYKRLQEHVFWAKSSYYRVLTRRAKGDWLPVTELDRYPEYDAVRSPRITPRRRKAASKGDGLSDVYEAYKLERKPSAKATAEFDKSIRRFIELHGDVPAITIDKPSVRCPSSYKLGQSAA